MTHIIKHVDFQIKYIAKAKVLTKCVLSTHRNWYAKVENINGMTNYI